MCKKFNPEIEITVHHLQIKKMIGKRDVQTENEVSEKRKSKPMK